MFRREKALCCSVLHRGARRAVAVNCGVLKWIAAWCSALQFIAVRCSALQCVAVCCSALSVLQFFAFCCIRTLICIKSSCGNARKYAAARCSMLQHVVAYFSIAYCSVLQCVAVCCSVLQCVAVCCSMLQYVALCHGRTHICMRAACGNATKRVAARCNEMLHVAACCSAVQCVAVCCCSVLQCVAVCCSMLQCVAVCCSVLQCVAVYCNKIHIYMTASCRDAIKCTARCSKLQHAAACCSMLQRVVACCSVLQRVAARCRLSQTHICMRAACGNATNVSSYSVSCSRIRLALTSESDSFKSMASIKCTASSSSFCCATFHIPFFLFQRTSAKTTQMNGSYCKESFKSLSSRTFTATSSSS